MARQESSNDLDEAVSLYRNIHEIAVSSGVQLAQHHSLSDLAKVLLLLFMQTMDIAVLDEAINHWRAISESVLFRNAEDIATFAGLQSELLSEMSTGLRFRSHLKADSRDIEHAVAAARKAFLRLPESGSSKWALASALLVRYHTSSGSRRDFEEAMLIFGDLCRGLAKSMRFRLRSDLPLLYQWARVAHEEQDDSATEAYDAALSVTERSLIVPATLEAQHDALLRLTLPLALHAASHAINQRRLEDAVAILERGRSMLWSSARRLRMPLDMVGDIDPDLRTEFVQTTREIELLSTAFDEKPSTPAHAPQALTSIFVDPRKFKDDLGSKLARKRELASRLEDLTTKIRALRGFDDFLQPPGYSQLQSAAQEGPVLIINHSKYRSDCIILLPSQPPTCVSLPEEFYAVATELAEDLTKARLEFTKSGKNLDLYNRALRRVLQELWGLWAQPIVSRLEDLGVKEGSRVWLVPTSVLSTLPLHAAGPAPSRGGRKKYFQDYFICSYIPSLSALIRARSEQPSDAAPPSMLVVGNTGGNLKEVDAEVEVLRDLGNFKADCLVGDQAQLAEVKTRLLENSWVHLVCHGILEPGAPFKSAFVLSGSDRLTLLDVVKSRIPNAEFAFLLPERRRTMWQMRDNDGPTMARDFYQEMFSDAKAEVYPAEVGYKKAARALNSATKKMRKRQVALEQWVNFIHIGA
ncbi:CHAT domain-containing protein [Phanerochaete sordida]|uniref:CHAT domain-containing protein n=1 Tax=Phanerochaete sordida TaxID=48140 RepID=A0A9P3LMP9_9APHY|nr:CHAT domain-containing protein [Phanerochaete sordida]